MAHLKQIQLKVSFKGMKQNENIWYDFIMLLFFPISLPSLFPVYASNITIAIRNCNFDCELLESMDYINLLLYPKHLAHT